MNRPAALPLRATSAAPRIEHLAPGDPTSLLTRDRRDRWRDCLERGLPLDVLVVGGGITGVGVALDAASRGLRVALVERDDLASGTSRWSSKLVHGGLRYLASGQVGVAWESARERAVLAGVVAPHLIRALPQVIPFSDAPDEPDHRLVRSGLTAADVLRAAARTPRGMLPRARPLDPADRRSPWCRRCPRTGSVAPWSSGTASSRTTPAWSCRLRARPPRTVPRS